MNENLLSPYTIITVLCFLAFFVLIAFIIRKKSSSLKKIINNKKINVIEFLPIRGGYSAIIFSVENEKFFFVGHKSGNSNLVQILRSREEKNQKYSNTFKELTKNDDLLNNPVEKDNKNLPLKTEAKKPLEQVNISDLLALHKKN
tara:strand:- start:64 stop:498 length:435 start_codon:yes stop_codon:yes gene_type:complete